MPASVLPANSSSQTDTKQTDLTGNKLTVKWVPTATTSNSGWLIIRLTTTRTGDNVQSLQFSIGLEFTLVLVSGYKVRGRSKCAAASNLRESRSSNRSNGSYIERKKLLITKAGIIKHLEKSSFFQSLHTEEALTTGTVNEKLYSFGYFRVIYLNIHRQLIS